MRRLTAGLTPTGFLTIVNQNFIELADIRSVGHYAAIVSGDDIVSKINTYYGSAVVAYGMTGNEFKTCFESALLAAGCLVDPSGITLTWVGDFLRITVTDNNGGTENEIYESKNGGAYTLATTLNEGVTTYDYTTWQNSSLNFRVRAKNGVIYSDYSDVVNIITPWVFKIDQSTLIQVDIHDFSLVTSGKTVTFNWGDGTTTVISTSGSHPITKDYTVEGQYFLWITGDVDWIAGLEWMVQFAYLHGTSIDKWVLPSRFQTGHFYSDGLVGDINNVIIPPTCGVLHFGDDTIISDITHYDSLFTDALAFWDIHIASNVAGGITGNVTDWVLPFRNAHLNIYGNVQGDLTSWNPWQAVTYAGVLLALVGIYGGSFTGDLSGWTIPDLPAGFECSIGCHFTKLPRGNFRNVGKYDFRSNLCDATELDAILAYIDAYFVGGVVPLVDCIYRFNGFGMGIPSAAGLVSKASIEAKYAAEGKSIAIYVNS